MSAARALELRNCAAIFDLDGTLIDSWHVAREAFCFAFRSATGLENPPVEAFVARLGMPFGQILDELGLPPTMQLYFVEYSQAHAHTIHPFEGITEQLARLRAAGVRLGIVTGKDRDRAQFLLANTRLGAYFDALVTPDDAPGKPDPRSLIECLKRLECVPSLAAFVGDSLADMQCGRRAVSLCVFARWGALQEMDGDEYDLVADSPGQLSAILLEWARSQPVVAPS